MFFALEPGSWYGRNKGISTAFTQLSAKCRVRPHKGMVIMLPAAGWLQRAGLGRHNHWEASVYPVWQAGSGIGPGWAGLGAGRFFPGRAAGSGGFFPGGLAGLGGFTQVGLGSTGRLGR